MMYSQIIIAKRMRRPTWLRHRDKSSAYSMRIYCLERHGHWPHAHEVKRVEPGYEEYRGGYRRDYQKMTKII